MGLKLIKCPTQMSCLLNDFSQITGFGVLGLKSLGGVCCVQWCEEGKGCVCTQGV
jgi:hypothetical protein